MVIPPSADLEEIRPKLIPNLLAGLEAVANHIWLILLPVVIDLSLWFAPHLRVKTVFQPLVDRLNELVLTNLAQLPQNLEVQTGMKAIQERLDAANLVSAIRSFPLGVPSLLADWMPTVSPVGNPIAIDLPGPSELFFLFVVFVLLGLILSSLYYCQICRVTNKKEEQPVSPGLVGWLTLQLLALTGLVMVVGFFFGLPALMIFSSISYINPNMGMILFFVGSLAAVWLLFPLVFSAHGIFTNHLPVLRSITASIQVVRLTLPTTSTFILICVVISQGLNLLWLVPAENSWLLLVGILGHAFISTSLITASFFFYRDGLRFFQTILAKSQVAHQPSSPEIIK